MPARRIPIAIIFSEIQWGITSRRLTLRAIMRVDDIRSTKRGATRRARNQTPSLTTPDNIAATIRWYTHLRTTVQVRLQRFRISDGCCAGHYARQHEQPTDALPSETLSVSNETFLNQKIDLPPVSINGTAVRIMATCRISIVNSSRGAAQFAVVGRKKCRLIKLFRTSFRLITGPHRSSLRISRLFNRLRGTTRARCRRCFADTDPRLPIFIATHAQSGNGRRHR